MPPPLPSVAVLIPCRNEERHIGRCLASILANDYPLDRLDIVVIDGRSTDRTREIVGQYARHCTSIRCLDNPEQNKPAALNRGIVATDSEIVLRIDAHARYAPDYISRLVAGLEKHQADNIGGIRESVADAGAWNAAVCVAVSHPLAAGDAIYRTGRAGAQPREVDTVFCGCYRRDVFTRLGGFHPDLLRTQDREFNARLLAAGGRIVLDPAVRCWYYPRAGLKSYARWTWQGAFWVFYADRFTATAMRSWRNWICALFVLWHGVVGAVALAWPAAAWWAAAPSMLYLGVIGTVSAVEAARRLSFLMFPSLMLLFVVTHWAYGLGSIVGRFASWLLPRRRREPPQLKSQAPRRRAS